MNTQDAINICAEYLSNDGSDDVSHLSSRELGKYCANVAEAASVLMESDDTDAAAMGEEIRSKAPSLWDYDLNGNYIGDVPYENGRTN